MTSRLLRDLAATIQATNDRGVWAHSVCRQAEILGRQGDTDSAQQAISEVRSAFGSALTPEVAAWLMLTEGVLGLYSGAADMGIARMRSAYAVAAAMEKCSARPTCAAWMALYSLNTRRFDEMSAFLVESLKLADLNDHQARGRASLVLADGFHFGGRFDLARPWYDLARHHASREGDESAISAMLHNIAAFRTSNLKLADALGAQLVEEARHASMEAASAAAYDRAIGTKSFDQFIPHVTAQVHMLEKRYEEAHAVLAKIDVAGLPLRVHAVHYADLATCAQHLGRFDQLHELVQSAESALALQMDGDDTVYANCRLASIHSAMGNHPLAAKSLERAKAEAASFGSIQADLVAKLLRVAETVPK
jgi:hypothetical protein